MDIKSKPVQQQLFVEIVPETLGNNVIEIRSTSNPEKTYRVDVVKGKCSCPAWIFQRGGTRKPCKHLVSMGITTIHNQIVLVENEL